MTSELILLKPDFVFEFGILQLGLTRAMSRYTSLRAQASLMVDCLKLTEAGSPNSHFRTVVNLSRTPLS